MAWRLSPDRVFSLFEARRHASGGLPRRWPMQAGCPGARLEGAVGVLGTIEAHAKDCPYRQSRSEPRPPFRIAIPGRSSGAESRFKADLVSRQGGLSQSVCCRSRATVPGDQRSALCGHASRTRSVNTPTTIKTARTVRTHCDILVLGFRLFCGSVACGT